MEHIQTFAGGATLLYVGWVARSWWIDDKRALLFQRMVSIAAAMLLVGCLLYQLGLVNGAKIVTEDFEIKTNHLFAAVQDKLGPIPHVTGQEEKSKKETEALIGRLLLPLSLLFDLAVVWGAGAVTTFWSAPQPENRTTLEAAEASREPGSAE